MLWKCVCLCVRVCITTWAARTAMGATVCVEFGRSVTGKSQPAQLLSRASGPVHTEHAVHTKEKEPERRIYECCCFGALSLIPMQVKEKWFHFISPCNYAHPHTWCSGMVHHKQYWVRLRQQHIWSGLGNKIQVKKKSATVTARHLKEKFNQKIKTQSFFSVALLHFKKCLLLLQLVGWTYPLILNKT